MQLPDSSVQTYTWDARGNLLHDGANTYTYNTAGRMVRAANLDATLTYTYTADGLRVQQAVNGDLTAFTWDWAVPGVPELLQAGDTRYLVGHDTLGHQVGNDWRYYLPDHLGSVRQSVNAAGNLVAAREWSPYGEEVGVAQAGLGFTGEWFDAAVGLQYLRARWYHPGTGRFTSRDPWEGEQRQSLTQNAYLYGLLNPLRITDPSGAVPYDRQRAAAYAVEYATSINPEYGKFGDADCTNFVSQALRAGGFPEDDQWFFDTRSLLNPGSCTGFRWSDYPWNPTYCSPDCGIDPRLVIGVRQAFCSTAWTLTDELFDYLTRDKGFAVTYHVGDQIATGINAEGELSGAISPVLPWAVDVGSNGQPKTEIMHISSATRAGDVVFYHQQHTTHVEGGGRYNHAAFVTRWGHQTRRKKAPTSIGEEGAYYFSPFSHMTPHIVDHSSPASAWGQRAINDTWSEVNMLAIVHIPDDIPETQPATGGCR